MEGFLYISVMQITASICMVWVSSLILKAASPARRLEGSCVINSRSSFSCSLGIWWLFGHSSSFACVLRTSQTLNGCAVLCLWGLEDLRKKFSIIWCIKYLYVCWGFPGGTVAKNPPANAGDTGRQFDLVGKIPEGRNGNPNQYSCLENSYGQRPVGATVHVVTKSWTWMSILNMSTIVCRECACATQKAKVSLAVDQADFLDVGSVKLSQWRPQSWRAQANLCFSWKSRFIQYWLYLGSRDTLKSP